MSTQEITDFLIANRDYFSTNDIIITLLRKLGWGLVLLFRFVQDQCAKLYDYTFGLVDITNWTGLNNFIQTFRPLITAFLFLSLSILGMMFILGKHKKHNVFVSFLIFAVVVTASNDIFSTLNSWTIQFKDAVADTGNANDANALVNANLYDVLYIDKEIGLKNLSDDNAPQFSTFTKSDFDCIDIGEVVNYKSSYLTTDDAKEILKQKLLYMGGSGTTVTEVSNGWGWNSEDDTDLGNEFYYRYNFHFGTYYLQALALILIFICLSYKNTRIIYEIFVSKILAYLTATDMSSSKKAVKVLTSIRDCYFALCFTAITLRSYTLFASYLGSQADGNGLGVTRAFVTLFVAFCVIDGANIMEKITGVDAGLSSFTGKMIAGAQMARGIAQGVQQHNISKALTGGNDKKSNMSHSHAENQNHSQMSEAMNQQNAMNQDSDSEQTNQQNMQHNNQDANTENVKSENSSGDMDVNNMPSETAENQQGMNTDSGKMENMDMGAVSMEQKGENEDAYHSVDQNMNQMDEALKNKESDKNREQDWNNRKSPTYGNHEPMSKNETEMFQRPTGNTDTGNQRGQSGYYSGSDRSGAGRTDNFHLGSAASTDAPNQSQKSSKEKKKNISPKDMK